MGSAFSRLDGVFSFLAQAFPPKPTFKVDQIPDLNGRIVLVTGGNTGIGKELIKVLLKHDAKVYLAARSREKAEAAIADLKEVTGKAAIFIELDLANLASVRKAAREFLSKEHELHVLFNNAGVMYPPTDLVTADGYDLQFGTNVLGHFYLTQLLLPALLAGTETTPDHHARVVTFSSGAAYLDSFHWDTFKDGPARRKLSNRALYGQSKLGNAVFARELAKRYGDKRIISVSLNPGSILSDLQRHIPAILRHIATATVMYPTEYGVLTPLWAGTMPEAVNHNGGFLVPFARVGKAPKEVYDSENGERLWNWLEEQIKIVKHEALQPRRRANGVRFSSSTE
ncbi:NAD(P)-binding protein [Fomes fomentarius]|nr:NAD(P)-binding protein [Fomes fomentarius]